MRKDCTEYELTLLLRTPRKLTLGHPIDVLIVAVDGITKSIVVKT